MGQEIGNVESTQTVSPLEALVVMELNAIQLEQERLSQILPILSLKGNDEEARAEFEKNMMALQQRSGRLERLLDSMSSWGADESDRFSMPGFRGELSAA